MLVGLAAPAPAWAAPKPHPHPSPKAKHVPPKKAAKPTPQPTVQPTPTAVPTPAPAAHAVVPVVPVVAPRAAPRPAPRRVAVRHTRVAPAHVVAPARQPRPSAPAATEPTSLTQALSKPDVLAPALRRNASLPMGMLVALVLFLFVQGRIDGRDPKLLLQDTTDDELVFGLPRGNPQPVRRPALPPKVTLTSPTSLALSRV